MDIAALSTVMAMGEVQASASIQVASQVKELAEQNGENLIKLMETSVNPDVGGNIDIKV